MPFAVHIDPGRGLGVVRLSGVVTGPEIGRALRALCDDEGWAPGGRVLWDGREIESLDLGPDAADVLKAEVASLRERIGAARVAVVAADDETYVIGYYLAIMSRNSADHRAEVFRDIGPALEWLALDELPPALREPS